MYGYYNQPYQPYQPQQYNELLQRLHNLENRGYGQAQYTQNPQSNPAPINNPEPIKPSDNKSYSIVTTEQQAWEQVVDLSGNVQVFYNPTEDCFYTQYFNASIPKTIRKTFKAISESSDNVKIEPVPEVTETQKDSTGEIVGAINKMSDKIEGKIDSLTTFIQSHPFIFTEKPKENKSKGGKK